MERLDTIAESIRQALEARNAARDRALSQARILTRHCANAIRAVHRDETDLAQENLDEARRIAQALRNDLSEHPELYYAGYTQDALKEFAEASIVYALVQNVLVPTPQELGLENATYLNGLAEATGEPGHGPMDFYSFLIQLVNGVQYGLLLFLVASGLT